MRKSITIEPAELTTTIFWFMHSDDVLPAGELDGAGTLVLVGHLAAMSLSNSKRYLWALSVSSCLRFRATKALMRSEICSVVFCHFERTINSGRRGPREEGWTANGL